MTKYESYGGDSDLAGLVRAQLKDTHNRRLLSRMPLFQPANDDSGDRFGDLLAQLDRAERRRN